jgi:hypothetical protein
MGGKSVSGQIGVNLRIIGSWELPKHETNSTTPPPPTGVA